ncbi:hypothetical protein DO97_01380 [Neosynechococcus sphagnicola sy1]|uniref:Uncharacterized protein n=1 Tax=Neosynechococcus sphagnicola sy1 TaxID=1497020 RepID=A0A098TLR1_9CYAN|nr:hypothetical protein [Neosynechococcus sphagnicola]KGF73196.1 hypothetical protein DO97_01380 [Neosynechococcus sphagnicola sy1]
MAKKLILREFPFIGSATLEARLNILKSQRVELQRKLPSPLYWWQFPGGRKIFWNWLLVQDYLLHGDRPEHQRLLEEYLATLPESR